MDLALENLKELKITMGNPSNFIGKGSYGAVYRLNKTQALKKIKSRVLFGVPALEEIAALINIKSSHVIKLLSLDFVEKNQYITADLVMPLYGGDLIDLILPGKLDLITRKHIAYQIVQGVADMHKRGWLHRDLKPGNILYSQDPLKVVIADLGMAKRMPTVCEDCNYLVETLTFRAPELLLKASDYSYPIDIWSLGLIILYVMTGITLNEPDDEIEQLRSYFQVFGLPSEEDLTILEDYPAERRLKKALDRPEFLSYRFLSSMFLNPLLTPDVLEVVTRICKYDPAKRPNSEDILSFKFFDPIRILTEPLTLDHKFYLTQTLLQESSGYPLIKALPPDRLAMLDWLLGITRKLKLSSLVYQQIIYLLDRYSQLVPQLENYQTTALAVLYIVNQTMTDEEYEMENIHILSNKTISMEALSLAVRQVILGLNGEIVFVTPANLLRLLFPKLDEIALFLADLILLSGQKFSAEQVTYGIAYVLSDNREEIVTRSRFMKSDLNDVVEVLIESFQLSQDLEYYPRQKLYLEAYELVIARHDSGR